MKTEKALKNLIEQDEVDSMECPTPCQKCNKWFELDEGCASEKWYPNIVICESCYEEEKAEIEKDEELDDLETRLQDAEYDVNDCKKELRKLGKEVPKIICLCGSLRFKQEFGKKELELVVSGNIVLTPCCMYVDAQRTDSFMEHKSQFDKMHFAKIDICDEVFVINKDGYIGDSTRNEIEHAFKKGKVINYLEPIE